MKDVRIRAIRADDWVGRCTGSGFDEEYNDDKQLKQVLDDRELDTPKEALAWALKVERGHTLFVLFLVDSFPDPHNPEPFDPQVFNVYLYNLLSDYDREAMISRSPDCWLDRAREWCNNVTGASAN